MSLTKERSFYLDNVKSVLIFFVVIGHFAEVAITKSDIFKAMFLWIYSFHMPLFIFLSGYLSKGSVRDKEKNKKRVTEYLFLYFLLNFVLFIGKALDNEKSSFNLLDETGVPWYLLSVAIMHLVSYHLQKLNQKTIIIFSIILAIFTGYDKEIGDFFAISRTIVFFPFFLFGQSFSENSFKKLYSSKPSKVSAFAILFFTIAVYYLFTDKIFLVRPLLTGRNPYSSLNDSIEFFGPALRIALYLVAILIGLSILSLVPKCSLGYFTKIGKRTLPIYFFHRIIIYGFDGLGLYELMQDKIGSFPGNLSWLILGILCTVILSLPIFEKPFILWNRALYKNK